LHVSRSLSKESKIVEMKGLERKAEQTRAGGGAALRESRVRLPRGRGEEEECVMRRPSEKRGALVTRLRKKRSPSSASGRGILQISYERGKTTNGSKEKHSSLLR